MSLRGVFEVVTRTILGLFSGGAEKPLADTQAGQLATTSARGLWVSIAGNPAALILSLADVTVGSSAAALASLACGPGGQILITALKANTVNVRISGTDVGAGKGTQLVPGASYTFTAANASQLWAIQESSGTTAVSVTAV